MPIKHILSKTWILRAFMWWMLLQQLLHATASTSANSLYGGCCLLRSSKVQIPFLVVHTAAVTVSLSCGHLAWTVVRQFSDAKEPSMVVVILCWSSLVMLVDRSPTNSSSNLIGLKAHSVQSSEGRRNIFTACCWLTFNVGTFTGINSIHKNSIYQSVLFQARKFGKTIKRASRTKWELCTR